MVKSFASEPRRTPYSALAATDAMLSRMSSGKGLLLVNLGSPQSPEVADVRRFLREFLSDPRVIDIPGWKRWLILNLFILPFRPKKSAHAYRQIWTDEGSPLIVYGENLARKVQQRLGAEVTVELAMRYGEPSIATALDRLAEKGIDQIGVFPLYPQYSSSTTGSTIEAVCKEATQRWNTPFLQIVPPFYDDPDFIEALAGRLKATLDVAKHQRVIFSYHGLPERHCRKSDASGSHCLEKEDCCAAMGKDNRNCYRAQCFRTTEQLAESLGLSQEQFVVCFQSRFGRDPWIGPHTEDLLDKLVDDGVEDAVILSPAFVADCLETVEELGIRGKEQWLAKGGTSLTLAPCLNDGDNWADALVAIARKHLTWL